MKITGTHAKQINIEKGIFESCGKYYFLTMETLSFERLKRFAELLPVVAYGKSYLNLIHFIHNLRIKMLTSEDPMKKVYFEVIQDLTQWDQYLLENSGQFYDNVIDDTLRFCALLWNLKDEDTTKVDPVLMEQKIKDWKEDMDMKGMFFFAKQQLPRYKELLKTLWEEEKEKQMKKETEGMEIPEN